MSVLLVPHVTVDHVLTHREHSHVIALVPGLRETLVKMVTLIYNNFLGFGITYYNGGLSKSKSSQSFMFVS